MAFDERDNTALIFINIGVLLDNLHRLHIAYATPGFQNIFLHGQLAPKVAPQPEIGYLCTLSSNPKYLAMATEIAVKAAMMVIFHEYAHFMRGHIAYLRSELGYSGEIFEAPDPSQPSDRMLDDDLRRVIEMDADQKAGSLASAFWRMLDHPAISPEDCKNEAFSMEIISAVLSNNLILGQYEFTDRYYSPLWRTQHILECFWNDFFSVDESSPVAERQSQRNEISNMMYGFQLKLIAEHERVYSIMGWGEGMSFARVEREIESLLGEDEQRLEALQSELVRYMPFNFFYQRLAGQKQY
jgi:hypothetical protein